MPIRKVGVIGAGTMGAGIAAQVANAGIPVVLLDIVPLGAPSRDVPLGAPARDVPKGAPARDVPAGANNRSTLAEAAVARLLKVEPAAFMHRGAAKLVATGNTEDDLDKLADCDWIVEAVLERADIKQALYRRLETVRRPGSAISSNTSTIPLDTLTEGMGEAFRRDFLITHFFNPPRYMRLLEIVAGRDTAPELVQLMEQFASVALGKSVVHCHDSPGFIANRLGIYWMQRALVSAIDQGLAVEEADAILSKPMGVPKTGVFGLMDLVGIDLGPQINASLRHALPSTDRFHEVDRDVPILEKMISQGLTGRKGGGGFYRLDRGPSGKRSKVVMDLVRGEYRPEQPADLPEIRAAGRDLQALLGAPGRVGAYAFDVMAETIAYAASLVPEAAATIADIDEAMRLGYAWKQGPFELADRIGTQWLADRLAEHGRPVPPVLAAAAGKTFYRVEHGRRQYLGLDGAFHDLARAPGVLMLEDVKLASKPVLRNASAALWDVGDGVACFEIASKSNTLDDQVLALLGQTIETVKQSFRALVIYTDADNFSLGANLGLALFAANIAAWSEIEKSVATGQATLKALKYAPFPVVAAPAGMALGGGCEIVLHADAVQAHAETYLGLVECGVGLVPGWGGAGEMLARWRAEPGLPRGPMPAAVKVFETISVADVSKSAHDAREKKFLRAGDGITMNRFRLLADAKARALALVDGYVPPTPPDYVLPGPSGRASLDSAARGLHARGLATDHDLVVAGGLAELLTGGETDIVDTVSEQQLLDLEKQVFLRLIKTAGTLARIEHTIETGKPLRN